MSGEVVRRLATVSAVDATSGYVTTDVFPIPIPALKSYAPAVGDTVLVDLYAESAVAIGPPGLATAVASDIQVLTGVNAADFTSASMADWVTGFTVAVPGWAADGTATAQMLFSATPVCITATATFGFRIVIGTSNGTTLTLPVNTAGDLVTLALPFSSTAYTVPVSTTSLTVKVQAQRTAGTGALRFNTATGNDTATLLTRFAT